MDLINSLNVENLSKKLIETIDKQNEVIKKVNELNKKIEKLLTTEKKDGKIK